MRQIVKLVYCCRSFCFCSALISNDTDDDDVQRAVSVLPPSLHNQLMCSNRNHKPNIEPPLSKCRLWLVRVSQVPEPRSTQFTFHAAFHSKQFANCFARSRSALGTNINPAEGRLYFYQS